MKPTTPDALVETYDGFLIDAYGVLVDGSGALPGAAHFLQALRARAKPWLVVTNDASRSEKSCAERYQELGVDVRQDQVLTSGSLLKEHFSDARWRGHSAVVLGTEDSFAYVSQAGLRPIRATESEAFSAEAMILADAGGFPFVDEVEAALSLALAKRQADLPLEMIVPNPDLIFPKRPARPPRPPEYGVAAGTVAAMIEGALELRHPGHPANRCIRLGKPAPALFQRGLSILGTKNVVMIGDQMATDIAGAVGVGMDAALVGPQAIDLSRGPTSPVDIGAYTYLPTWTLPSLAPHASR